MKKFLIFEDKIEENMDLFLEHFSGLSSEDCYFRFLHSVNLGSIRDWLLGLKNSKDLNMFFVVSEDEKVASLCQLSINQETKTAEIAISTLPEFRGSWIG